METDEEGCLTMMSFCFCFVECFVIWWFLFINIDKTPLHTISNFCSLPVTPNLSNINPKMSFLDNPSFNYKDEQKTWNSSRRKPERKTTRRETKITGAVTRYLPCQECEGKKSQHVTTKAQPKHNTFSSQKPTWRRFFSRLGSRALVCPSPHWCAPRPAISEHNGT